MQIINNFTMITFIVGDMNKSKVFYVDKLGLEVKTDYRMDDNNWWVSLAFPSGGMTITLARSGSTSNKPAEPGTLNLYFSTPNILNAHNELNNKGIETGEVMDNLYGPGSGVKFFQLKDPDGNQITFAQE